MALPNLSENKEIEEKKETKKSLDDINSNIFDVQVEVEDGFNKLFKQLNISFDLMGLHLDIANDYLFSIDQTLKDSFKLSQTQQQEQQIALQKAKAEGPDDKKDEKVLDKNKSKKVEEGFNGFFGFIFASAGAILGGLVATALSPLAVFGAWLVSRITIIKSFISAAIKTITLFPFGEKIVSIIDTVITNIKKVVTSVLNFATMGVNFVKGVFTTVFDFFAGIFNSLKENSVVKFLSEQFIKVFGDFGAGFDLIKETAGDFLKPFSQFFKFFGKTFDLIFGGLFRALTRIPFIGQILDFAIGIFKGFQKGLSGLDLLFSGVTQIFAGAIGGTVDIILDSLNFLLGLFGFDLKKSLGLGDDFSLEKIITDTFFGAFNFIKTFFNQNVLGIVIFDTISRTVADIKKLLMDGFILAVKSVAGFFNISLDTKTILLEITNIKNNILNGIVEGIKGISGIFGVTLSSVEIKETLEGTWNDIKKLFTDGINQISEFFSALNFDSITDKFKKSSIGSFFGFGGDDEPKKKVELAKVETPKVETPKVETPKVEPEKSSFTDKFASFFGFGGNEKQSESENSSDKKLKVLEKGLADQQSKFSKQSEALNTAQNKNDNMKQEEKQVSQNNTSNTAVDQSKRTTTNVINKIENSDPLVGKGYSVMPIF